MRWSKIRGIFRGCLPSITARSQNAPVGPAGNHERTMHFDGTWKMKHEKMDPDRDKLTTIPHWTGEFSYHGITYPYTMVGTDPSKGSATTVVPTVIIPLRFVFADGSVVDSSTDLVDGQTAIQGIINSPIFQRYPFPAAESTSAILNGRRCSARQFLELCLDQIAQLSRPARTAHGATHADYQRSRIKAGMYCKLSSNSAKLNRLLRPIFWSNSDTRSPPTRINLDPRSAIFDRPVLPDSEFTRRQLSWRNRVSSGKDPVAGAQTYIVAGYMSQSDFGGFIPNVACVEPRAERVGERSVRWQLYTGVGSSLHFQRAV